jgi:hypothetical protein
MFIEANAVLGVAQVARGIVEATLQGVVGSEAITQRLAREATLMVLQVIDDLDDEKEVDFIAHLGTAIAFAKAYKDVAG